MKAKLPFRMGLRLGLQGKWVTKFFTVLLSAAAFMLFAIASTAYTFDEGSFQVRGYRNYMADKEYYLFRNSSEGTGYSPGSAELLLTGEEVALIEDGVDLNFLFACRDQIDMGYFLDKSYFRGEKYKYDEDGEIAGETEEYKAYLQETEGKYFADPGTKVSVGSEACYKELNYRLLAGRYPEGVNEIAVSEEIYEHFVWGGYVDAIAEGCYTLQEFSFVGETYEAYAWDESVIPPKEAGVKIDSYEDLLGKTLANYELKEENRRDEHETLPEEVVVVGVVDMSDRPAWPRNYPNIRPFGSVLRSEAWLYAQREAGKLYAESMVARNFNNSDKAVRDALTVTLALSEAARPRFEELSPHADVCVGAYLVNSLTDDLSATNLDDAILLVCGIGVVFLIFSVLLNAHLMTAMTELKRRQVGILRALGAKEGQIECIFLTGAALLSAVIFLFSLAATIADYYGFWQPLTLWSEFGVSPFVFNGWTVLILAGLSFTVPLLSTLVPLKRFLKKPVVENITGNFSK